LIDLNENSVSDFEINPLRALFVDVPHGSFEQLVSNAEGFEVEAILLTHFRRGTDHHCWRS